MSQRIALVIGGTSGVGLATARMLRERGARVHIVGRGKERLDELAVSDPDLVGHRADAADGDAMRSVVESVGRVDWLVVAASGGEGMGPVAELDLEVLRRAFDSKFWVHLTAIKAALPHLAPDGSITLISAISARNDMPGTAGLAAVNGAIESMVKPLAAELAPIRVNAVSPGLIDTAWWSGMPEDARREWFASVSRALPVRHVATAEEVAEAVAFAATNANVTGTVLETDGGARLVTLA
ncbi:SDR family oxidoreductase [Bailinhaonella thermotolerans]|uniref:SDR family oxidoreductase n=1 Tax=Bailinhaonella thermotolerans TaxID=1070861 RepID=A0A3A4AEF0_9ACTN|nr:SDR family oxidoreductase [Bailinhaonella thermotolerans]RJL25104.1 SDR family oxidoreductase [Bailinhaonella thermotolerans]